jgi:peptidyl-prolyl cis-trans isomerase D
VQVPGGGYLWYEVTAIKPSREQTLDEVKPLVEERMRDEQIAERVKARATALLEKLKTGASLADLVTEDGLKVESTFGLMRNKPTPQLPARPLDAIFRTPKGEPGLSQGASPSDYFVFRVTDTQVPAFDATSAEGKRIEDLLRRAMVEELTSQYLARLQSDVGAKINTDVMRRAITGSSADQN